MTAIPLNFPNQPDPHEALDQESGERRRFTPEQYGTILQALYNAFQINSDADLPALFQQPAAVTLVLTTFDDLIARYQIPGTQKHHRYQALDHALKLYCTSSQYSHAMITGDTRYNLDMEPGDPLTDADRKSGQNRLKAHHAQQKRVQPKQL